MSKGEVAGTMYGLSSKGWIDQELFDSWFKHHFLRYAPPQRPMLLLMDGHSSHCCPQTIHFAAKEKVIIFTLPPNTTHVSQPLDKGCFGPLKTRWRQICHEFQVQNPGKSVSRYTFSELFSRAWVESMNMANILSGFRCTGIFPLDRSKLIHEESVDPDPTSNADMYIPVLTTMRRRSSLVKPKAVAPIKPQSTIAHILKSELPTLPLSKLPLARKSSRVLTSSENLKMIAEKERKKQEKIKLKEERKQQRKRKKLEKEKKSSAQNKKAAHGMLIAKFCITYIT